MQGRHSETDAVWWEGALPYAGLEDAPRHACLEVAPRPCRFICTKGSSCCFPGLSTWHSLSYRYTKCLHISAPLHQRQCLRWSHRVHLKQLGRWEGEGDSNHFPTGCFAHFFIPAPQHHTASFPGSKPGASEGNSYWINCFGPFLSQCHVLSGEASFSGSYQKWVII